MIKITTLRNIPRTLRSKALSRAILVAAATALLIPNGAEAAPEIVNLTKSADAGDLISIQGEGFGTQPSVTVTDGTVTTTPLTLANGGILNHDDAGTLISAKIPANSGLAPGKIYTVTVTSSGVSGTKQLNVPEVRGYLDLGGLQITPNRTFRIYGDNLYAAGLTTSVFLNQGSSSYPCNLVGTPEDRFILTVTTPSNLPTSGTFTVFVRAGGVTSGFGVAGPQNLTGRANGTDVWGLGVPWGADYAPFYSNKGSTYNVKTAYGATGNGTTNDAAAIQNAINAANAAGGGTVYLPAGTYNVGTSTISVKSNVVLQGDGQTLTTVKVSSSSASARPVAMDGNLVGLVDLRVLVEAAVGPTAVPGRECVYSNNRSKLFALRCTFDQYKPAATNYVEDFAMRWENANQIIVKDCKTYMDARSHKYGNIVLQNNTDMIFMGNDCTYRNSRTWLDVGNRVQVENNTLNICNDRIARNDNCGGFRYSITKNAVFLNNTIQKKDVVGDDRPVQYFSDLEAILTELAEPEDQGGTLWGIATGGSSSSLIDTTKSYTSLAGQWLFITRGPGAGQHRRISSNTGTTITVSPAWEIPPSTGSTYTVSKLVVENSLVKGNTVKNLATAVSYYDCHVLGAAVVGNTAINSTGIVFTGFADNAFSRNASKDIVIENNLLADDDKLYATRLALESYLIFNGSGLGNMYYGATMYNNSVEAPSLGQNSTWPAAGGTGEGYYLRINNGKPDIGFAGPLFDKNTVIDCDVAFRADLGAQNATFWDATFNNCGKLVGLFKGFPPQNLAVSPTPASPNLALLGAVSTSITNGTVATNAVDGDLATLWQVSKGSTAQFIRVDLKASKSIERVKLTWDSSTSNYYPTAYTIQVSPDGSTDWTTIHTVTNGLGGVSDFTGLTGTGRYLKINITGFKTTACQLKELEVYSPTGIPSPWQVANVNVTGGTATFSGGNFTVNGVGAHLAGTDDRFVFVYQTASGDCDIVARLDDPTAYGVIIRGAIAGNPPFMATLLTASNGRQSLYRTMDGQTTSAQIGASATRPLFVRVNRTGNSFTSYTSTDGVAWTVLGIPRTIVMPQTVYIGLAQPLSTGSQFSNVLATP